MHIQNGGCQSFVFLKNVDNMLDIVTMLEKSKDDQNLGVSVDWRLTLLISASPLFTSLFAKHIKLESGIISLNHTDYISIKNM